MKYAIIQTGGKQYKISEGEEILVEKLANQPKNIIVFSDVLLVIDDNSRVVGHPTVNGAKVEAEIMAQIRGPKIRVATYKSKSRYRKVKGHRQSLTRVKITRIVSENVAKRNPSVALAKGAKTKKIVKQKK